MWKSTVNDVYERFKKSGSLYPLKRGQLRESFTGKSHGEKPRKNDTHAILSLAQNSNYKVVKDQVGCSINTFCTKIQDLYHLRDSDKKLHQNLNAIFDEGEKHEDLMFIRDKLYLNFNVNISY